MPTTYTRDPEVTWVVEQDGLWLIHHRKQESLFVGYPEAAVWDFVTQKFGYSRMVHLLSVILSAPEAKAKQVIHASLELWVKEQYLQKQPVNG